MKILKRISAGALLVILAFACNEGIDDISYVAPGPDETAPGVTITYPFEGARIQVKEDVAPVDIQFQATDDIEIGSIALTLDGTELTEFSDFKDYRRAVQSYRYNTLENGLHTLTVTATDLSGKSTSKSVNFEKVEPYQPKYEGEIFYTPFDGDYLELLTIKAGTTGGSPTFVDGVQGKAVSFDAANKGYVLFPSDALAGVESFSMSFFVKPDFIDANTDNGIDGILGLVNFSNTTTFWGNIDFFVENGSNPAAAKMVIHVTNDDSETWINEVNNVAGFFGTWTHHVVTYDGAARQFKYYINGVLKLTKPAGWTDPLTFKNAGQLVFGTVQFQTNPSLTSNTGAQDWASYLTGELDEVRLFNRALSADEVQQIYDDVM
jgi:hypothetical protein